MSGTFLDKLPTEVQIPIVNKLPLKSLLRFACTSKSVFTWMCKLLISPLLPQTGYHLYSNGNKYLLCKERENCFVVIEITSLSVYNCSLVGSCYGLVCYRENYSPEHSNIVTWNPFLGKSVYLPIPVPADEKTRGFGFGFDRSCFDYKIVQIGIVGLFIVADIHTMQAETNTRIFGSVSHSVLKIMTREGIHMNGAIHWILKFSESDTPNDYAILTYDLAREEFHEMGISGGMVHRYMALTILSIDNEAKLTLYHEDPVCNVWVMEDYGVSQSWKLLCTVKAEAKDGYIKVLHSRKNGKIVLSTDKGSMLFHDPQTQITTELKFTNYNAEFEYLGPFRCSLALIKQTHHGGSFSGVRIDAGDENAAAENNPSRKRKADMNDVYAEFLKLDKERMLRLTKSRS